jgi:hypothetical protein
MLIGSLGSGSACRDEVLGRMEYFQLRRKVTLSLRMKVTGMIALDYTCILGTNLGMFSYYMPATASIC